MKRQIVEYVPQPDRAAEEVAFVDQAVGPDGVISAPQTEYLAGAWSTA